MEFFVQCQRYGETTYLSYEGITKETADGLLAGLGGADIEFIDEAAFAAGMATMREAV